MSRPDDIDLAGVSRRYRTRSGGVVAALDEVDVRLPAGALTVIAGPSGSGKSTMLGLISCIDRPDEGRVVVAGVDVGRLTRRGRRRFRRSTLACVLPQPSDNLLERLTAADNVRWAAAQARRDEPDVHALLDRFGLMEVAHKRARQLSGGEQQRVAIAAVMAARPTVLAADEPTSALDQAGAAGVVAALRMAADTGTTVVVASHDPNVVAAADVVVRLDHGQVVR